MRLVSAEAYAKRVGIRDLKRKSERDGRLQAERADNHDARDFGDGDVRPRIEALDLIIRNELDVTVRGRSRGDDEAARVEA